MHEETSTNIRIGNERMVAYLNKIEQVLEEQTKILAILSNQLLPAESPLTEAGPQRVTLVADDEIAAKHVPEDVDDLQLMKATVEIARSFVDVISNQGSVVGRTSTSGTSEIGASHEDSSGGHRSRSGGMNLTMEAGSSNGEASNESDSIRIPSFIDDTASIGPWSKQLSHRVNRYQQKSLGDLAKDEKEDVETMTTLLENYILTAVQELAAHRFLEARNNLERAAQRGEERESVYKYPFEAKLKVQIKLVAAHIGLGDLDVAQSILESLFASTIEDPQMRSEALYHNARLHRARYCSLKDAKQLTLLEEAATQSYVSALKVDSVPKPFLMESAELCGKCMIGRAIASLQRCTAIDIHLCPQRQRPLSTNNNGPTKKSVH